MGLKGMKYRFSAHFHREHTLVGKTEGPIWVLSRNSIFFKTSKNGVQISNQTRIWASRG
jgi:hypothetical protein